MDRYESARSQMVEERRKVQVKVAKERRKLYETIEDKDVAVMGKKRVYLYGQMKGNSHLEETIKRQLSGN